MANSEAVASLATITLSCADLSAGIALSDAAGWNQTSDDWALFIDHGDTVGLRTTEGRIVATAAALPYGPHYGWISMVLVASDWRHRGLATKLLCICIDFLRARNLVPALDATPAGAAVYGRFGFKPCFGFDRWENVSKSSSVAPHAYESRCFRVAGPSDLDALSALDAVAGVERRFLFERFLARPGTRAVLMTDGSGFALLRGGNRASQLGPVVAPDSATAIKLLETLVAAAAGPVFLDVPSHWPSLHHWLLRKGFRRQRSFSRMVLDPSAPLAANDHVFALAGPEFG